MINWREIPFVRLLLPVIIGILWAIYFDQPLPFLNGTLVIILLLLVFIQSKKVKRQFRWVFGVLANLFFIALAYQVTYYHDHRHHPDFLTTQTLDEPVFVLGTIVSMPDKSRDKWIKVELQTHKIGLTKDSLQNAKGTILAYVENEVRSQNLAYGDLLFFQTRLSSLRPPENPKAFNYAAYLKFQNIHFQSFIKERQWTSLAQGQGHPILELAFKWRLRFLSTLKKHLPSTNEFAVGSALILGYKDDLPDELKSAYAGTGAMHVLAVSGLHVGLVYLILAALLQWIKIPHPIGRFLKLFLLIVGIWAFAILTGASASVMRAATMFTFLAIGRDMQRYINIYNTLAASAFCLLLYQPFLLKNVGFQLSYLAVLGIIYFQPKIYRLWMMPHKMGDYIWTLVTVSIAATISTLPISLYYFHQFPLYFWLSGLVVVPAAGVILSAGLLLFAMDLVLPILSPIVGTILYYLIWVVNALIFLIQQLPAGLITGIWISATSAVLLYSALGSGIVAINTKKIKWLLGAVVFCMLFALSFAVGRIQQYYKKELVIYHIYKNSLIDSIDGQKVFSIKSDSLAAKNIVFAAQNYRWSKGIQKVHNFNLSDTLQLQNTWLYQNRILGFYHKRLAILNQNIIKNSPHKIKVDYLLLQNNPKIKLETVLANYEFEQLIFDASNSTWQIEKWKKECAELNIPYHNTHESGAFRVFL